VFKILVEENLKGEVDAGEAENREGFRKEIEGEFGESELEACTITSSFAGDFSGKEPTDVDIEMEYQPGQDRKQM
jgi:hypothetical protein